MGRDDETRKFETDEAPGPGETLPLDGEDGGNERPRIDRYRILRTLGAGGMGVVYLAEQTEPIRRQVALKLIRGSGARDDILARFQAEQQTLAQFDHPNVAHVLDAGTAEDGSPYFVMEYVDGESLDAFCARGKLDLTSTIELFLQICDGIQHAHQRGIIHRDIKPSNVLVSEASRRPSARIIDFGIARAIKGSLVDRPFATQAGQAIGTLAYMSPEQAGAIDVEIDTRTDIYSLGLTLYYMLTGTLPLDPGKMGLTRFLNELSDDTHPLKDPRKALAESPGPKGRHEGMERLLSGDLHFIVMKAISKSPAQRYQTVEALASDLRRFTRDEPVVARPPSRLYYFRKFVRRHTVAVAGGTAALIALIAGLIVSLILMERARVAERMATAEADAANEVVAFLAETMSSANPIEAGGQIPSVKDVVDKAAARIETTFDDQPRVKARILGALGDTYGALAEVEAATRLQNQAISLVQDSGNADDLLVSLLQSRATLRRKSGDYASAEADLTRALGLSPGEGVLEDRWRLILRDELAKVYELSGRYNDARALFEEVVAGWRQTQPANQYRLATALNGLGAVQTALGETGDAIASFKESLDLKKQTLSDTDPSIATTMANIANIEFESGDAERALQLYQEVDRIQRRAFGEQHPAHADTLGNMAQIYEALGEMEATERAYSQAIDIVRAAYGPEHVDVAFWQFNLGIFNAKHERYGEAKDLIANALPIFREELGDEHPYMFAALTAMAEIHANEGEFAQARDYTERALEVGIVLHGEDSEYAAYLRQKLAEYSGE